MILEVGHWGYGQQALQGSCARLLDGWRCGARGFSLEHQSAPTVFGQAGFCHQVATAVHEQGIPAPLPELEITEGMVVFRTLTIR